MTLVLKTWDYRTKNLISSGIQSANCKVLFHMIFSNSHIMLPFLLKEFKYWPMMSILLICTKGTNQQQRMPFFIYYLITHMSQSKMGEKNQIHSGHLFKTAFQ